MIRIVWFIRLFCMASSGFAESENSANRERGFVEAIVRAGRADLFRLRLHSPLQSMGWLCFIDGTRLCIRTIQCDTTVIGGLKEDKNHLFSRPGGSCVGDFLLGIARLVAKKGQLGCSGVHQNGFMWVMVYLSLEIFIMYCNSIPKCKTGRWVFILCFCLGLGWMSIQWLNDICLFVFCCCRYGRLIRMI